MLFGSFFNIVLMVYWYIIMPFDNENIYIYVFGAYISLVHGTISLELTLNSITFTENEIHHKKECVIPNGTRPSQSIWKGFAGVTVLLNLIGLGFNLMLLLFYSPVNSWVWP